MHVCEFSCLSFASEQVLTAVKNVTEEQIRDENWIKENWNLERGVAVGNMSFWYTAWKFRYTAWKNAYLKYAVETQQYIHDNQIQQQAATAPQERFVFT